MKKFRLAIAQINTVVGDFGENRRKILKGIRQSRACGADLAVFPELAVTGYPPEDLLFKRSFVDANLASLRRIAAQTKQLTALVGFVDRDAEGRLFNAAAVLAGGRVAGVYRKVELPNYGVFDEKRYFSKGTHGFLVEYGSVRLGLSICEDIWLPDNFVTRPPYEGQTSLILNLSASPYHIGKQRERRALVQSLAKRTGAHVAYVNLVGGQDELIFDGGSLVAAPDGRISAEAGYLEEDLLVTDLALRRFETPLFSGTGSDPCQTIEIPEKKRRAGPAVPRRLRIPKTKLSEEEEVYRALVLGTRDYVQKNGFKKVLVGLSGGVDSALVARVAADALGASCVIGVTMPSRYTSHGTYRDAKRLAANLKIKLWEFGIEKAYGAYLETLKTVFSRAKQNIAEENLQARIRGNILMALSNKFGYLVLTTGNKSEMATGYCTLYGDMAGGFAVIKDVPKTLVYRLARWRNRQRPAHSIPEATLRRAPSAELRFDQKDQDTLPPYSALDRFLTAYVEQDRSPEEMVRSGFSRALVRDVMRRVDRNEYKRRQAPPGIKITPKAFGRDRRMPITNKFGP